MNGKGTCYVCGEPATAACDASDCHHEMCDAHMYAHLTLSFSSRSAAYPQRSQLPEYADPLAPPVQWFCAAHKALADL